MKIKFSENLRKLRKLHRFTQEEMAEKLSIKRATYGGYEREEIRPPADKMFAIAEIFGITVGELLDHGQETNSDVYTDFCILLDKLKNSPTYQGIPLDDEAVLFLKLTVGYIVDTFEIRKKTGKSTNSQQNNSL